MTSEVTICAERLGKKYLIVHQSERERYKSLRDSIARSAVGFRNSLIDRLKGGRRTDRLSVEDFWAVRDVSFDIKRGEVVGIIGSNGAGKSTLLKIFSRITEPTEGRATIRGRVASLLEVGTGFHPELTGRENIYLNGSILGMTRKEILTKFDEIVAFADVGRFLDTPVKRYSSGMYLRLAFAVAAHLEPEILFVDEVLAVGDAEFQKKCLGKLHDVSVAGRTVLFVSHQLAAIESLCSRALLIERGRLTMDDVPANVIRTYLNSARRDDNSKLDDWSDRETGGQGRLIEFEVLDGSGQQCSAVPVGAPVAFRLTIELSGIIGQPLFGVQIHSSTGEPLMDLRSFHDGLRLGRTTGRLVVEARLDRVPLYPDDYSLSPWVWDNLSKTVVDWVKHCATLRVLPSPGPHGDLRLDPAEGKFYLPSAWRVVKRGLAHGVLQDSSAR